SQGSNSSQRLAQCSAIKDVAPTITRYFFAILLP
ncbi:MAG: hypothetical protein RIQ52_1443, partial [Pseudomonadota bacterium]